jgi:hypothetical protein
MYYASLELIEFEPQSCKTNIAQALKFTSTQKRKPLYLLSDFMSQEYEHTCKLRQEARYY